MSEYKFFPDRSVDSYKKADVPFIISVILMWGIGMFTLFACSNVSAKEIFGDSLYFVKRQLIASLIGFVGFAFFALCPLDKLRKLLPILLLVTLVLCVCTFIPGIRYEKNGAARWIKIGFLTFQPSELVKFSIVLYLCNYFDKYVSVESEDKKSGSTALAVLGFFTLLVVLQKDFSTGLFLVIVGLCLCILTKVKILYLAPFAVLVGVFFVIIFFSEEYRVNRVAAFFDPSDYAQTYGYQTNASLKAIRMGGFWGQGIGEGLEKMNNIPEVQSDYIFAGWAEAMGFFGVFIYFVLLIFFVVKGMKIVLTSKDRFASYSSLGCILVILIQSLLNISVVSGLVPSTGIPLPFFSSGGSSIMITLCMCGFIVNASKCDKLANEYESNNTPSSNEYEDLDVNFFK